MELKEGDKAPDFSLPASTGETISLADLAGKKVVVYFYPKDNTPGCTTERAPSAIFTASSRARARRCWASAPIA